MAEAKYLYIERNKHPEVRSLTIPDEPDTIEGHKKQFLSIQEQLNGVLDVENSIMTAMLLDKEGRSIYRYHEKADDEVFYVAITEGVWIRRSKELIRKLADEFNEFRNANRFIPVDETDDGYAPVHPFVILGIERFAKEAEDPESNIITFDPIIRGLNDDEIEEISKVYYYPVQVDQSIEDFNMTQYSPQEGKEFATMENESDDSEEYENGEEEIYEEEYEEEYEEG